MLSYPLSLTNIPFVTGNKQLDEKFIAEATSAGLLNLKGHRLVGGMRASLYNAFELEGVKVLVDFMKEFELKNKGEYEENSLKIMKIFCEYLMKSVLILKDTKL